VATGNGSFDTTNVPPTATGDTILKLSLGSSSFSLLDYFTPFNQASLSSSDTDVGSGGALLLPDQSGSHPHELVQVSKGGTIYNVDRDQMTAANQHYCSTNCTSDPEIVQELVGATPQGLWGMPAYWNGTVFVWGEFDVFRAYSLGSGLLSTSPTSTSTFSSGYPGPTPSVSSNGTSNGIVWAIDTVQSVLQVFDATNLATELYDSTQAGNRDKAGAGVKFTTPTIANGKVYIGTQTELDVYGLLP